MAMIAELQGMKTMANFFSKSRGGPGYRTRAGSGNHGLAVGRPARPTAEDRRRRSPGAFRRFEALEERCLLSTGAPGLAAPALVGPPSVATQAATSVADTTAVLNGLVNPGGGSVDASFQYSTDPTLPTNMVTTLAGSPRQVGSADGIGPAARFFAPGGVAVDAAGDVFVADEMNATIREISPGGVVTTLAGSPGQRENVDGTGPAARFTGPEGVAVDAAGNLFVADAADDTIREISPGGVVTTLAGSPGQRGSADGTGPAARFSTPSAVAVDAADNVYVADVGNGTIRKVAPGGVVTTLAGSPGRFGSADGIGAAARFDAPEGIAADAAGNVYVADGYNATIRKISPGGVVTTLAGTPGQAGSADGTGAAARFASALGGLAVDAAGNVYVGDFGNNTIREITPAGVVTTLAGTPTGMFGSSVDGIGPAARFWGPAGLAVDAAGNIYVADENNDTIRKLTVPTVPAGAVPGGSDPVAVTAALGGLTPGTTYYYRAMAAGAGGTAAGTLLSFTTSPTPPPPPPVVVTGVRWETEKHGRGKVLDITFSGALDAAGATDASDFAMQSATPKGHPRRHGRHRTFSAITYDPATSTVRLTLRHRAPDKLMRLAVGGSLIRDARGNLLDGNHDGRAGGVFVATLTNASVVSKAR